MDNRIREFVMAVCNEWCKADNTCAMGEHGEDCNKKNCLVFPIAVQCLARLDARSDFYAKYPRDDIPTSSAGEGHADQNG